MQMQLPLKLEMQLMHAGKLPRTPMDQVEYPEEPKISLQYVFECVENEDVEDTEW